MDLETGRERSIEGLARPKSEHPRPGRQTIRLHPAGRRRVESRRRPPETQARDASPSIGCQWDAAERNESDLRGHGLDIAPPNPYETQGERTLGMFDTATYSAYLLDDQHGPYHFFFEAAVWLDNSVRHEHQVGNIDKAFERAGV